MTARRNSAASVGAAELHDDVAGNPPPREVAASGEGEADGRVEVGARHLAHEQDDRHHHQPGRGDGCGAADGVGEGLAHHPAARRHEDEEEGPEQLGEEPPPLLLGVLEVLDRVDDRGLEPLLEAVPGRSSRGPFVAALLAPSLDARRLGAFTARRRTLCDAAHRHRVRRTSWAPIDHAGRRRRCPACGGCGQKTAAPWTMPTKAASGGGSPAMSSHPLPRLPLRRTEPT